VLTAKPARSDVGNTGDPLTAAERDGRPRRARTIVLAVGIVVAVVALDQLTKVWAVSALSDGPISVIGDTVELQLSRNTGGAFSLFQGFTPLLAVLAVVVAIGLGVVLTRAQDPVVIVALSLVLAGAIGNLCDRVFRSPSFLRGAVVDFVKVGPWPSFNVADSAITIGAILLVVWGWRRAPES
jgi:signal peptidase II